MGVYLVERYLPGIRPGDVEALLEQTRLAGRRAREGGIRFLESVVNVEDEACLSLYEGPSLDAVRRANARAGVPFDRITEVARLDVALPEGKERVVGRGREPHREGHSARALRDAKLDRRRTGRENGGES